MPLPPPVTTATLPSSRPVMAGTPTPRRGTTAIVPGQGFLVDRREGTARLASTARASYEPRARQPSPCVPGDARTRDVTENVDEQSPAPVVPKGAWGLWHPLVVLPLALSAWVYHPI